MFPLCVHPFDSLDENLAMNTNTNHHDELFSSDFFTAVDPFLQYAYNGSSVLNVHPFDEFVMTSQQEPTALSTEDSPTSLFNTSNRSTDVNMLGLPSHSSEQYIASQLDPHLSSSPFSWPQPPLFDQGDASSQYLSSFVIQPTQIMSPPISSTDQTETTACQPSPRTVHLPKDDTRSQPDTDTASIFQSDDAQEAVLSDDNQGTAPEPSADDDPDWTMMTEKSQQDTLRQHVQKHRKPVSRISRNRQKPIQKPFQTPSGDDVIQCTNCNACGLFYKLHGTVRPLALKTDVIKRRNRKTYISAVKKSRRHAKKSCPVHQK